MVHEPTIASTRLQSLRTEIQGRVLVAGDDGYDAARRTWSSTTFEQRPTVVVLPETAADVVRAIAFAREHDLPVGAQAGGHGHPRPVDGGLLLNLAGMTGVRVTPGGPGGGGTARVEAGAVWRDVIAAAVPHGLAPLNGFAATVGVAGYTLGGGVGWMVRQYGAAAGSVRSMEVVTSDARLLQVSEDSYPDLFWGLRGGGGNFGIVTALELALYPVSSVFGGFIAYPIALGTEVLTAYAEWATRVPDTITSAVRIVHYPPVPPIPEPLRGASAVVIMACCNEPAGVGESWLQPLRSLGMPLVDTFRPMPYAEVDTIANDPPEAPPLFTAIEGTGVRELSPEVIDTVLRQAGDRAGGIFLVEARHLGGALLCQPEGSMAFEFRSPWFLSALATAPTPDALHGGREAIGALLRGLGGASAGERLVNVLEPGAGPALVRTAYSAESYLRLGALKDAYDPGNVFRFNHNIGPAGETARPPRGASAGRSGRS